MGRRWDVDVLLLGLVVEELVHGVVDGLVHIVVDRPVHIVVLDGNVVVDFAVCIGGLP